MRKKIFFVLFFGIFFSLTCILFSVLLNIVFASENDEQLNFKKLVWSPKVEFVVSTGQDIVRYGVLGKNQDGVHTEVSIVKLEFEDEGRFFSGVYAIGKTNVIDENNYNFFKSQLSRGVPPPLKIFDKDFEHNRSSSSPFGDTLIKWAYKGFEFVISPVNVSSLQDVYVSELNVNTYKISPYQLKAWLIDEGGSYEDVVKHKLIAVTEDGGFAVYEFLFQKRKDTEQFFVFQSGVVSLFNSGNSVNSYKYRVSGAFIKNAVFDISDKKKSYSQVLPFVQYLDKHQDNYFDSKQYADNYIKEDITSEFARNMFVVQSFPPRYVFYESYGQRNWKVVYSTLPVFIGDKNAFMLWFNKIQKELNKERDYSDFDINKAVEEKRRQDILDYDENEKKQKKKKDDSLPLNGGQGGQGGKGGNATITNNNNVNVNNTNNNTLSNLLESKQDTTVVQELKEATQGVKGVLQTVKNVPKVFSGVFDLFGSTYSKIIALSFVLFAIVFLIRLLK